MTFILKKSSSFRFVCKQSVAVAGSRMEETCSTMFQNTWMSFEMLYAKTSHEITYVKKLFVLHLIFAKCALIFFHHLCLEF